MKNKKYLLSSLITIILWSCGINQSKRISKDYFNYPYEEFYDYYVIKAWRILEERVPAYTPEMIARHTKLVNKLPWVNPTLSSNKQMILGRTPGWPKNSNFAEDPEIPPQNIFGYQITDPHVKNETKVKMILIAGQHSCEMTGNWVLEGMVNFLAGIEPEAELLRKKAIFYVYPDVNPEGRYQVVNNINLKAAPDPGAKSDGCYRGNPEIYSAGLSDHNRVWNTDGMFSTIDILKKAMITDTDGKADYLWDMHGPQKHANWRTPIEEARTNEYAMALMNREPDVIRCGPESGFKINVANGPPGKIGLWAISEEGLRVSYPYIYEPGGWSQERFKESGRNLALALYDVLSDKDPLLYKQIDISKYKGSFPTVGDLNNDGKVDFTLSYLGPYSCHLRLIALDSEGKFLWQFGDSLITSHGHVAYTKDINPCRGMCTIYDIDDDGKTEVLTEFWNDGSPVLYILDGETGSVKKSIPSPLFSNEKDFIGKEKNRPTSNIMIAHLHGKDKPVSLILKYSDTDPIQPIVVALDNSLNTLWRVSLKPSETTHHATIADIDSDGNDEIILGGIVIKNDGSVLYNREVNTHTDFTDVIYEEGEDTKILYSICGTGPAYCVDPAGKTIWEKTQEEVPHGQGIWGGNFIPEHPGKEVIILRSGHFGDFLTVNAKDGSQLATFQHRAGLKDLSGDRKYPDTPMKINWISSRVESLWIPVDRIIVDGRGNIVQSLGKYDEMVKQALNAGTSKQHLAVQAIPVDVCGDNRDELLLYQPYQGEALFIFTQQPSTTKPKFYIHSAKVYNFKSYL